MKTSAALALALSTLLAAASTAQAQERQLFVYSGPVGIELPASALRGSAPAATTGETQAARKVRVVMQSPYGN